MSPPPGDRPDVLVVGGGPAGAAAAIVLADGGHRVTVVERSTRPAPPGCGGLLTPRARAELGLLGIDPPGGRPVSSIVLVRRGREIERPWPRLPGVPSEGLAIDRRALGEALLERAESAGATVLTGLRALDPIVERGFVRGAHLVDDDGRATTAPARYLVVADGAASRFGRSIGTFRRKDWPFVAASSNTWATAPGAEHERAASDRPQRRLASSPAHGATRLEVHLGLTARDGSFIAGLGWALPGDDDTVRLGIGLWSTSREFGVLNGNELLGLLAAELAPRLGIDPEAPLGSPEVARIPVGGSVIPVAGPAHLVAGDAAGVANPLSVTGIESALWSGRLAGEVLVDALDSRDPTALQRYPSLIAAATGGYYKVGRLATRFAGHPTSAKLVARTVTRNRVAADTALRIGLQHLRRTGGPEIVYRLARTASRFGPDA